jgi:hypothetical protein
MEEKWRKLYKNDMVHRRWEKYASVYLKIRKGTPNEILSQELVNEKYKDHTKAASKLGLL